MKYTLSLLLLLVTSIAFSQIPKPLKDTYVNDFAKVLSKSQIRKLNDSINLIEKSSGVQLALVIVNEIPKEYDLEEYSLLIARRWKVGNKEDGLVYVAAINQRKQRLEVARNLEPIFTTVNSEDVLAKTKANFRLKNYGKGLAALVSDIAFKIDSAGYGKVEAVQPVAAADQHMAKAPSNQKSTVGISWLGGLGIVFVAFILVIIFRAFKPRANGYGYVSGGYGGGRRSNFGSFAAGAATGFILDRMLRRNNQSNQSQQGPFNQNDGPTDRGSGFGNWGSSGGSSGDGGSSSSSGGFSGGGASSDW